jgi:hypothetical protein
MIFRRSTLLRSCCRQSRAHDDVRRPITSAPARPKPDRTEFFEPIHPAGTDFDRVTGYEPPRIDSQARTRRLETLEQMIDLEVQEASTIA